jgi:hypothetical protein
MRPEISVVCLSVHCRNCVELWETMNLVRHNFRPGLTIYSQQPCFFIFMKPKTFECISEHPSLKQIMTGRLNFRKEGRESETEEPSLTLSYLLITIQPFINPVNR